MEPTRPRWQYRYAAPGMQTTAANAAGALGCPYPLLCIEDRLLFPPLSSCYDEASPAQHQVPPIAPPPPIAYGRVAVLLPGYGQACRNLSSSSRNATPTCSSGNSSTCLPCEASFLGFLLRRAWRACSEASFRCSNSSRRMTSPFPRILQWEAVQ